MSHDLICLGGVIDFRVQPSVPIRGVCNCQVSLCKGKDHFSLAPHMALGLLHSSQLSKRPLHDQAKSLPHNLRKQHAHNSQIRSEQSSPLRMTETRGNKACKERENLWMTLLTPSRRKMLLIASLLGTALQEQKPASAYLVEEEVTDRVFQLAGRLTWMCQLKIPAHTCARVYTWEDKVGFA